MEYKIIKFIFETGVHFGNGSLDTSEKSFMADTLFSALCIEAVKEGEERLAALVGSVKENRLIIGQSQEINVSLQVISTQLIFWLEVWV